MDYAELHKDVKRVKDVIGTVILGKDSVVELLMVGLLARCLACSFQRIQFTPDLMPACRFHANRVFTWRSGQIPTVN